MAKHILLALSTPLPGRDAEFTRWLDEHHIPDVLQVPGFVSARCYAVSEDQPKAEPPPYRYANIYEVDTDDLPAAFAALRVAARAGVQTDTRDRSQMALWSFTEVGPVRTAVNKESA